MNRLPRMLAGALVLTSALLGSVSAAPATDVETKCMAAKLKAAGKAAGCVHKALAKAVAQGTLPDYSKCDAKLGGALTKAETKAILKGAPCLPGLPPEVIAGTLGQAADKSATQTGRGSISPTPEDCGAPEIGASYTGGNYSLAPKCVAAEPPGPTCGPTAKRELEKSIARDLTCPDLCGDGAGCDPKARIDPATMELRADRCCLASDPSTRNSVVFGVRCSPCG